MPWDANDYIDLTEIIDTSSGKPFISGGTRQYTRKWNVIVRQKGMGTGAVCSHPNLPKPYASYQSHDGVEFDLLAVLVDYQARRKVEDEYYHWIVEATYSTEVPEGGIPALTLFGHDALGSQNSPWLDRPVVEWDWEETTESPARDLDGKPYVNSASMPFMPAPAFPVARQVLLVSRNESAYSRVTAQNYAYAVNSDVFLGADPGTVRSSPVRMKVQNRGPLQYYRTTYRLVFNLPYEPLPGEQVPAGKLRSWQPEILDQGTHQLQKIPLVPFYGKPVPIIRYGSPVHHPVLLDGFGRELLPNVDGTFTPQYRKFKRFKSFPFAPIIETGIFGGL